MTDNLLPPCIPAPVLKGTKIIQGRFSGKDWRRWYLLLLSLKKEFATGKKRVVVVGFITPKEVIRLYVRPWDTVFSVLERLEKRKKQNAIKDK